MGYEKVPTESTETVATAYVPRRKESLDFRKSFNWYLYFCIFAMDILTINCGTLMVWASPVILKLQLTDPDVNPLGIPITTIQTSILVAAPWLSSLPPGPLLIAKLSDILGRKKSMIVASLCLTICLLVVAFATNIMLYYICWFIIGVGRQALFINIPIYNNEIAEPSNRGKIGLLSSLGLPVGVIYAYMFGSITSVKVFTLLCIIPNIIHLSCCCMIAESPVYLLAHGNACDALNTLEKTRRHKSITEVEFEFAKIKHELKYSESSSKAGIMDLFQTRASRKAMYISIVILSLQAVSGCVVILSYMGPIFKETGVPLSEDIISTIVGLVQLFFVVLSSCIVDKTGKRVLVLFSSFSCILPTFFLGIYFYLQHLDESYVSQVNWIPILCILMFILGYNIGLGPIPLPTVSELFCSELRSLGVAINLTWESIISLAMTFSYPLISERYGSYFCMWVYSLFTCIGSVILYFILPETTEKSFSEIQKMLNM